MRDRYFAFIVLSAALLVLNGCTGAAPKQAKAPSPPAPRFDRQVEPIQAEIAVELPPNRFTDPVGLAIVEARARYARGEELYREGFLRRSKEEFDEAIDLLFETARDFPVNARLEHEIADLSGRIHALEITALKAGDGFTDQSAEPAAIDDLRQILTFPAVTDPKATDEIAKDVQELGHDLPIDINERVLGFLDLYRNRRRGSIEVGLERMGQYRPMIEKTLREEGLPLDLIYLCQAESAFQPRALSRARAKGMWQFISSRGKEYGLRQSWWIDERSDPEKSTRAAARHLKDLYEEFGDWYLAMAAYNSGPVRVQRAIDKVGSRDFWTLAARRALPNETINYVPNILALAIIGKNPEKYGFSIESYPSEETERVHLSQATDLRVIAEQLRIPLQVVRDLNPHVLKWTTPPDDSEFELILPRGTADEFRERIADLPEAARVQWRHHTTRRGETLTTIARKYGTSVNELAQANNVSMRKPLRAGTDLIIPISGSTPSVVATAAATPVGRSVRSQVTGNGIYTIRSGDSLSSIAVKFGVTIDDLKEWNGMESNRLIAGRTLRVRTRSEALAAAAPAAVDSRKVVHRVRAGDTLARIAVTYKTTVSAIRNWNRQNNLAVIRPGDEITIFLNED